MKPPRISIITISLNAEDHIEQTIQSVLSQTYKNTEYILVDGGSTDRTAEIINQYKDRIDHFISGPDGGIADAMNKGVALATGDYVVFLHADDYFKNGGSLEHAVAYLDETTEILACNIQFGKRLKPCKPRGFNFWLNFKQGIYHQGALCHRSLIEELKGFDTQFRIAMDFDFFLRAYRRRARLVKAPVTLAVMRDIGISSRRDWESLKIRFDEERSVQEKNCHSLSMRMLYDLFWFMYLPYRQACYAVKNRFKMKSSDAC